MHHGPVDGIGPQRHELTREGVDCGDLADAEVTEFQYVLRVAPAAPDARPDRYLDDRGADFLGCVASGSRDGLVVGMTVVSPRHQHRRVTRQAVSELRTQRGLVLDHQDAHQRSLRLTASTLPFTASTSSLTKRPSLCSKRIS